MLYLNNVELPEKEWKPILEKHFNTKKVKKGQRFNFCLDNRYSNSRLVNGREVKGWPPSLDLDQMYVTNLFGVDGSLRYIRNIGTAKAKKGVLGEKEFTEHLIVFNTGLLDIPADKLDLYFFMLFHPRNKTNPLYYKEVEGKPVLDDEKVFGLKPWIFREKNEALEQEEAFDLHAAKIKAQYFVINEVLEKEAREIYKLYNNADFDEAPLKKIKNYLLVKAGEDPKGFLEQINSEVRSIKSTVQSALQAEVIFFDKKKSCFRWSGSDGTTSIKNVARGKDTNGQIMDLVKFIQDKDSGTLLKELEEKVREVEASVETS